MCFNNFAFDREVSKLPLAAGPLTVIPSQTSVTKQECRREYHRKRAARFKSPPSKGGPPAVESQSMNSLSSAFIDGKFASSDSEKQC